MKNNMAKVFIATSNGDYNAEIDSDLEIDTINWELNEGCQNYVIVTKKQLDPDDYSALCSILDKYHEI